jgi:hypothetical protein
MCAHGHLFATRYARISIKLIFDGKAVLSEAYRVSQSSDEASIRHAVDGAQTLSDSHGFPTQVSALKLGEHARFKDCTGLRGKEFVEGRGAGYCKRFRAQTSRAPSAVKDQSRIGTPRSSACTARSYLRRQTACSILPNARSRAHGLHNRFRHTPFCFRRGKPNTVEKWACRNYASAIFHQIEVGETRLQALPTRIREVHRYAHMHADQASPSHLQKLCKLQKMSG